MLVKEDFRTRRNPLEDPLEDVLRLRESDACLQFSDSSAECSDGGTIEVNEALGSQEFVDAHVARDATSEARSLEERS